MSLKDGASIRIDFRGSWKPVIIFGTAFGTMGVLVIRQGNHQSNHDPLMVGILCFFVGLMFAVHFRRHRVVVENGWLHYSPPWSSTESMQISDIVRAVVTAKPREYLTGKRAILSLELYARNTPKKAEMLIPVKVFRPEDIISLCSQLRDTGVDVTYSRETALPEPPDDRGAAQA